MSNEAPLKPGARLYLVSAPSGAGKTTLVRQLVAENPRLTVSISYTTRRQRPSEQDGRDYFFTTEQEFARMVTEGQFLEYARVFDHHYGTGREQVEQSLAAGIDMLLEIDWQGARQVRAAMPDAISIFILPPSRAELERRLRGRRTDSDDVIERRLRDAEADMSHWDEFDYIVVNDNFEHALGQLKSIITGAGHGAHPDRAELKPLMRELLIP
ncbi:MAG TPA: guanylate kinase [Gammaproteobacteria bacterium]|nr:guanylate kinase [Gammaproteobacteria bacterium]